MRYALISDIHANMPALTAVLNSIASSAQHLRTGGILNHGEIAAHGG